MMNFKTLNKIYDLQQLENIIIYVGGNDASNIKSETDFENNRRKICPITESDQKQGC